MDSERSAWIPPAWEPPLAGSEAEHLLEEYGRHTGHADLLREAVDGRTGEDPPPDWVPPSPTTQ